MEPDTICLGVAIDHRIRRLFKPVPRPASTATPNSHVSFLQTRGRELGRSKDEIKVTVEMAGPASPGGIAVILQQPRDHPFERGTEAVIEDCETLAALRDIFAAVSCGTLNLRRDISVVDLLPYITEAEMNRMSDASIKNAFQATVQALCIKEPDVTLCAGRIRLLGNQGRRKGPAPTVERDSGNGQASKLERDDRKGDTWKLESAGVGRTFDKYPVVIFRDKNREIVRVRRVNGFHPSLAMNYHPVYSRLRQLLFLAVAQTCRVYGRDWDEEAWMGSLRASCSDLSKRLGDVAQKEEPPETRETKTIPPESKKYLPYYGELYSKILKEIRTIITSISGSVGDASLTNSRPAGIYDGLLGSSLSEQCNDASLVLRTMLRLKGIGWPQYFDKKNGDVLRQAASDTLLLTGQRWDSQGWFGNRRLKITVQDGIASVGRCVTTTGGKGPELALDLNLACAAFLKLAEALEVLLWDLLRLESSEGVALPTGRDATPVDPLAYKLGGLTLS